MDEQRARQLLSAERDRVERALAELSRSAGEGEELSQVDQHTADAGSELYQREQDAGLAAALHEELTAIERAEERLASGTYGRSVESGEPIPDARLEAMPWAERTVEEQGRLERSG